MNHWMNECMHVCMYELIVPISSSKSAPNTSNLFKIFIWNRALATVSCTFCQPHLPKMVWDSQFFLKIFMWNRALAKVLCTFCRPLLQIQARNGGNRDPTILPEKTLAFAPETVFKPEFTRSRPVTLPIAWWWCGSGWHDDVVDMLVRMLPMTTVRNSEVFQLNLIW